MKVFEIEINLLSMQPNALRPERGNDMSNITFQFYIQAEMAVITN